MDYTMDYPMDYTRGSKLKKRECDLLFCILMYYDHMIIHIGFSYSV